MLGSLLILQILNLWFQLQLNNQVFLVLLEMLYHQAKNGLGFLILVLEVVVFMVLTLKLQSLPILSPQLLISQQTVLFYLLLESLLLPLLALLLTQLSEDKFKLLAVLSAEVSTLTLQLLLLMLEFGNPLKFLLGLPVGVLQLLSLSSFISFLSKKEELPNPTTFSLLPGPYLSVLLSLSSCGLLLLMSVLTSKVLMLEPLLLKLLVALLIPTGLLSLLLGTFPSTWTLFTLGQDG